MNRIPEFNPRWEAHRQPLFTTRSELDGLVGAGMKKAALRLVRRLLKAPTIAGPAFAEALNAMLTLADSVKPWKAPAESAYSRLPKGDRGKVRFWMMAVRSSCHDDQGVLALVPTRFTGPSALLQLLWAIQATFEAGDKNLMRKLAARRQQCQAAPTGRQPALYLATLAEFLIVALRERSLVLMNLAPLLVVLFSAAEALADTADLIQNGSFETPAPLTGWTLSHDYLYPFWKRQWDGGGENLFPSNYGYYQGTNHIWMAFNAQEGSKAVNVHSVSLYQIVNTVPGQSYRLHFFVGSYDDGRPPSGYNTLGSLDLAVLEGANLSQSLAQFFAGYQTIPAGVSVDWNRFDNPYPGLHEVSWLACDYSFVAWSSQAVFIFQGGGYSFSSYTGLDDVSLTLVPEPAGSRLGLLGVALLSFVLPRSKRPPLTRP